MAAKKNPSIYDDRSTIGSSDELDEYGVWVKLEPHDLSESQDLGGGFLSDLGSVSGFPPEFNAEVPPDGTASEDLSFEDFNGSDGNSIEEDLGFDDVEAVRKDIQSSPVHDAPQGIGKGDTADVSTQILMKIADELASIKGELSSLKSELLVIRNERPDQNAGEDEADGTGFFDEEDDDKIALTGDELNNIIHTADFTEETGSDAGEGLNDEFISLDTAAMESLENNKTGEELLYDGLGRPLYRASGDTIPAQETSLQVPEEPAPAAEIEDNDSPGEILYDGLGRPLNRTLADSEDVDTSLETKDTEALKALRENGVEPMTPPPDDTSYLEEDPLAEEQIDLSDAIIDEPDLSEGIKETPLEEPSLDNLSLIDLDNMDDTDIPKLDENLFEDVSFDNFSSGGESIDLSTGETAAAENNSGSSEFTEVSFDDPIVADDEISLEISDGDLNFEMLTEDAELPIQENVQDNVITDDSFESISLDDDGEDPTEPVVDENLEQALPDGMQIVLDLPELDLPLEEIDELCNDLELDDKNFDGPGAADTADAGDLNIDLPDNFSIEIPTQPDSGLGIPSSIKMELKNVLVYMDKLLESLPEEKIEEFAKSEYFDTYKKLFEELGIS
ncbi:hypothetical protein [Treponema primitia]|uniref:hypothetical protein n=1 Tax=Treponema primitia TaxID=88058 RepID=UPI0002554F57|nr:hypothetical protein [Treponema primitia]